MDTVSPDEFLFEIDGPGVERDSVDPIAVLRLAETSFRLALKVADRAQTGLKLRGLRVYDKCIAVAVDPNSVTAARLAALGVARVLSGEEEAPSGCEGLLTEARKGLRELGASTHASFRIGADVIPVHSPALPVAESPWEQTELRVRPVRITAKGDKPRVEFLSESEHGSFILDVSLEDARKLGSSLLGEVDISLEACRGIDGRIVEGSVLEVISLLGEGEGDADEIIATWRQWFAGVGDWGDIERVSEALGRD